MVHINATSKNAADDKLRQSLRRFAQSYPAPASVVLVSGDINFAAELSDLRHRHNLRVICLHNAQAQTALLSCAHEAHRFDHFTSDLPFTPTVKVIRVLLTCMAFLTCQYIASSCGMFTIAAVMFNSVP